MEKNTVLSPRRILESIYECEPSDLQLAITLNPDVERIAQAMESYAQQFQSPAPLSAEEIAQAIISRWVADVPFQKIVEEVKPLLSQRQPVAPEREEAATTIHWNGTGYVTNDGTPVRVSWATGIGEVPAENKGASGSADGLSKKGGEE